MAGSVGVVVPAYRPTVERLIEFVEDLRSHPSLDPAVVRVELDAPAPGVEDRLRALPADVHAVPARRGKGRAVTCGFEALGTDVLAFADADGSTPADSVADVVEAVRSAGTDLAVGSRRHPDATVEAHQTFARRRLGDGFARVARRLVEPRLYDYQCGAKALTAAAWAAVREHLFDPGFGWDLELVAVAGALDLTVAEVPVTWHDRAGSTVSPVTTPVRLAKTLLSVRRRAAHLGAGGNPGPRDGRTPLVERVGPGCGG